ncbi:MAG TPA: hypothetical protein VLX44_01035 [Xanthobacteraceae bacterium]|nr:hypothetical protein [Xanthobacteraceae bacterium]
MRRSSLAHPPGGRASARAAAALLAIALSGCASFGGQKDAKQVDPNIMPADYKGSVMAFLQNNPYDLVGVRAAELATPELRPFGTESRYVVCLRAAGPDWRKEKVFIYYGGTINQFIDATPETCGTAAYQAFPEITTLMNQLRGNKK